MRNVSNIISIYTTTGRQGNSFAIKPVQARGSASAAAQEQQGRNSGRQEASDADRRKAARRVIQKTVLLDVRSGYDRRRRNRREDDIVEHIDEEV